SKSDFSSLQNQSISGSLRYAGLNDALRFTRSADGTQATLHIPSTGFTKTFTGTNEADVNDQMRDFVLQEGAKQYAKFINKVNEETTVGVIDGNPLAATAMTADDGFYRYGLI